MLRADEPPFHHASAANFRTSILWAILLLGLVAEFVVLSVHFNPPAASGIDPWLQQFAIRPFGLPRTGVAYFAALVLLLAPNRKLLTAQAQHAAIGHRSWPWLSLHVLTIAALYYAATVAFGDASGSNLSSTNVALCKALGAVAAVFWCMAAAPWKFWRVFILQERVALGISLVVAIAARLAGKITDVFWRPLASGTLFLTEHLLRFGYPEVGSDPSEIVLGTPEFSVRIAPECSGYEGIGLITIFLALYLWMFRARIRFPQALLLFPICGLAIWFANVLRIAALVAIGISYSPVVALGGFHSQAGWVFFVAVSLGAIFVTHRVRFFTFAGEDRTGTTTAGTVSAALLLPFIVLMASIMVTSAFAQGIDFLYPMRVLATAAALIWFYDLYKKWDWGWSWPSICIGGVVFVCWLWLEPVRSDNANATLDAGLAALRQSERVFWIAFRIVGSVLVAPLVEEMAFRGYLLRRLTAADFQAQEATRFNWGAFLISSAAFGALHGRWFAGTIAGLAYALAFYRRRRLGDAVIAHMTSNGMIAIYVILTGAWSLWS